MQYIHQVDPKGHTAAVEGLRALYMIREYDMTEKDELLKALLASDEAPEATSQPGSLSALLSFKLI
ncbi:hypothetical protein N181_25045 [Sinorhizobium fredii USDA 205]|nr:hypothetical protein N181_25045 [Sinorhizobium fredii USDA 205]GEC33471.1 hypothetical protein EFR01_36420 [Sinorhizobium fredii]GLS11920.1 hypothetical protein GCM10007864_55520 [Sinorhizobium fredii]